MIADRIKGITKHHVSGLFFFLSMLTLKNLPFFGLSIFVLALLSLAYKEKKNVHNTA